ncbi:AAA family ATPase [Dactylosporangium salmoneum]|uniref:Nicotinamide-nucleotide adenylyltransferase n=1 Tax=Dactylosporangium salmoneum TaxID=53361 RepID=A0ABN3I2R8_9ACTN
MTLAEIPPPLAWYGSSFAYYDDEPSEEELDLKAAQERERRLAGFSPQQFGPRPGAGFKGQRSAVVLGRFLPVHDGHRYLIEYALAHTPDVFVFVRVSGDDPIPWEVRRDWLAELFPGVTVTAVEDEGEQERWTRAVLDVVRPDYVFAGEGYDPTLGRRLGAQVIPVSRDAVPVSGTHVRADPWACERYLPPAVRAFYARRVCLIGPESTGKTTIAKWLAEHYGTVWVPERMRYAGPELLVGGVSPVAHGQQAAEDLLARRASRVLFCDTDLLSVRLWSERLFGTAPQWLVEASQRSSIDLYLLTSPDLPFTGPDTYNTPTERREFHAACERELNRLGRPYVAIPLGKDRLARAVAAVDELLAR